MLAQGDFESFKKGNRLDAARDAVDFANQYQEAKKIKDFSRFKARSRWNQGKDAFKMALEHRRAIERGDLSVFLPAFVFAIAKDVFIDMIPLIGTLFGFFIAVYLFVFLWGKGTLKLRIIVGILSFFDMIPAIGILPMSTISVFYVFYHANKNAKAAREKLSELEKVMRQNGGEKWYDKWVATAS